MEEEWKIGEIRQVNGEWYQCVEEKKSCINCAFRGTHPIDICVSEHKCLGHSSEDIPVIFKKLEKIGEPFSNEYFGLVQKYELKSYGYSTKDKRVCFADGYDVFIKIEQTKEDMEDNKKQTSLNSTKGIYEKFKGKTVQCLVNNKDGDLVNGYGIVCGYRDKYLIIGFTNEYEGCIKSFTDNVFLENRDFLSYRFWNISHVDDKPFIKPFNLEAARSGKPVCTRDGRKARIICFDRINGDYYKIVACVTAFDGDFEEVLFYGIDGYIVDSQNPKDEDLMMLPEKKEGWINVYKGGKLDADYLYPSKEDAVENIFHPMKANYIETIKVELEE